MTAEKYLKAKADIAEYEREQREEAAKKAEKLAEFCNELFPGTEFFAETIRIDGSGDTWQLHIEFIRSGDQKHYYVFKI
jgi:hypothetical protein